MNGYLHMSQENVTKLIFDFIKQISLSLWIKILLPKLRCKILYGLVLCENSPFVTIFQTQNKVLFHLRSALHILKHFLVALHAKCFKKNKNWNQFRKTPGTNINSPFLNQHLTHSFGINSIWNHPSDNGVELRVSFDQNSILNHLLLN